jgi:hypothetical protein
MLSRGPFELVDAVGPERVLTDIGYWLLAIREALAMPSKNSPRTATNRT